MDTIYPKARLGKVHRCESNRWMRVRRLSRGLQLLALISLSMLGAGQVSALAESSLLFKDDYAYLVPPSMRQQMLRLAPRKAWQLYPQYTRKIDIDEDGEFDYVAIGLGADGGFGAQIRYRLRHYGPESIEEGGERLGHWYWGVVVGPAGNKVYEAFNP